MKYHPSLILSLAILGAFTQASGVHAAENVTNGNKQDSSSEVILLERGTLNRDSPVLRQDGSSYQLYSFRGIAGQRIHISLESRDFDSYLILLNDDGEKIAENDDQGRGTNDALISMNLPYSGLYQVVVNTYRPGEQGAFTLVVERVGQTSSTPNPSPSSCDVPSFAGNYAQVRTQDSDPLRVRSAPNGTVIGSIPSGWQVRTYETDATGNWTRVGSHFGPEADRMGGEYNFGNAPYFRPGWVATRYLVDLGFHCEKPAWERSLLLPLLFGQQKVTVGEDWVAMGDRLSATVRSTD
jgi:hypothetical protein